MTRINCIPVEELHNAHLIAQYRELPRVFKLALNASLKDFKQTINSYRLGAGHVTFFYDKLFYLAQRHEQLVAEMQKRGYATNITNIGVSWSNKINDNMWQDWTPTQEAIKINKQRIEQRLKEMRKK